MNFDTWKLGKTRHNKSILHDWPSQPKVWFYLGIKSNWISCTEIFKAGSLKKVQNENIYWWDEFNRSFSYKSRHGHWEKVSRYWMMCKSDALKSCQKKNFTAQGLQVWHDCTFIVGEFMITFWSHKNKSCSFQFCWLCLKKWGSCSYDCNRYVYF